MAPVRSLLYISDIKFIAIYIHGNILGLTITKLFFHSGELNYDCDIDAINKYCEPDCEPGSCIDDTKCVNTDNAICMEPEEVD